MKKLALLILLIVLSCSDECGVPFGDDSSCADECNVPNGDNSSCSDCAGIPNGLAYKDECGTCDDNAYNDCVDCSTYFQYHQSQSQAFYYFQSITINNVNIDINDWVGAFKGEKCVGARKWDVAQCSNAICDVPVMGDAPPPNHPVDTPYETEGYMLPNEKPIFKIYDVSEKIIYDTKVTLDGDIYTVHSFSNNLLSEPMSLEVTTFAPCQ